MRNLSIPVKMIYLTLKVYSIAKSYGDGKKLSHRRKLISSSKSYIIGKVHSYPNIKVNETECRRIPWSPAGILVSGRD